jgi:uncharacterized protein (TIGR00369 family)
MLLTDDEIAARREWFRAHWESGIPFAVLLGLEVDVWSPQEVVIRMPLRADLCAHEGIFHGGAIGTLIDTAGTGVVIAGQDFNEGSRIATVSMTVNYVGAAAGEGARATARVVRRGRRLSFAEAEVTSLDSGKLLAHAMLTLSVSGERRGLPEA